MRHLSALALLVPLLLVPRAQADYLQALDAYNQKQFEQARSLFLQASELGDSKSQRILSTMLAKGEGGPVNAIDAYVWAAVAAIEDTGTSAKIRDAIGAQLPPAIKETADKRFAEFQLMYTREAVQERLSPVLNSSEPRTYDLQYPAARVSNGLPVEYPKRALEKNDQAIICASFYINEQGQALAVKSYAPWDNKISLTGATEKQLASWSFRPADPNQRYGFCINYLIEDDKTWRASSDIEKQLQLTTSRSALTILAKELSAAGTTTYQRVPARYATQAWTTLALQGDIEAAFELGSRLWRGDGCRLDEDKALRWMDMAARNGHIHAKAFLALTAFDLKKIGMDAVQKQQYLHSAANAGNRHAQLQLAINQLRSKDRAQWNQAVSSLSQLDESTSIAVLDWRAYGLSLLGDLDKALSVAEDAHGFAKANGLKTNKRQDSVTALRAGKPALMPEL